jgi:hypothetical protein
VRCQLPTSTTPSSSYPHGPSPPVAPKITSCPQNRPRAEDELISQSPDGPLAWPTSRCRLAQPRRAPFSLDRPLLIGHRSCSIPVDNPFRVSLFSFLPSIFYSIVLYTAHSASPATDGDLTVRPRRPTHLPISTIGLTSNTLTTRLSPQIPTIRFTLLQNFWQCTPHVFKGFLKSS